MSDHKSDLRGDFIEVLKGILTLMSTAYEQLGPVPEGHGLIMTPFICYDLVLSRFCGSASPTTLIQRQYQKPLSLPFRSPAEIFRSTG
jgi:hypothetical protein